MISTGLEAVLIKIAGIGLTVKHLGQTIKSMNDKLVELVTSFSFPMPDISS